MSVRNIAIALVALGACAGAARAGPCAAPVPAVGAEIHGPVLHVLDGRRLCVALGETPDRWVELTLNDAGLVQASDVADANPRGTLMALAFAQNVTCKVTGIEAGRALAACSLDGRPLVDPARKRQAIRLSEFWR